MNLLYCLFILKTLSINWGTPFYVSKENARRKTVDYYGLRHRSLYLAFICLGRCFDAVYCGRRFGLCFESLGRVAAIEAYPPRAGLYDYYGTGFADIAVVGTDYRAYVVEPV